MGYVPIDHRIESFIEEGAIESVIELAEQYPRHVAEMLEHYRIVLFQWQEARPDLLKKLLTLTWDRLDRETRKQFAHFMIRMVYRVSKSALFSTGAPTGDIFSSPFNFQADEVDLDRTVEKLVENPLLSYDSIFVADRKKRKRSAVIVMDASGSMQGENLSMAAIAAASLAMNLEAKDEYGVVLFSERVNIYKRINEQKKVDQVVYDVLDILPEGRTNITLGLTAGLQEIQRSTTENRIGILLTDGWQNIGDDPLAIAKKYPRLHVINLPGGNPELSQKIAKAGRGYFFTLRGIFDVPKAIFACLE